MTSNYFNMSALSASPFVRWPFLILYYEIVRAALGLSYTMIYGFIAVMFLLRTRIEDMLLVFFGVTIFSYVSGQEVEANHYMSFVFGFMVLLLLKKAHETVYGDINRKTYKNTHRD